MCTSSSYAAASPRLARATSSDSSSGRPTTVSSTPRRASGFPPAGTSWISAHEPELALRRREPFDAVCGDHEVFLEADVPVSGHCRSVLDREHVPHLDEAERGGAVAVPARRQ